MAPTILIVILATVAILFIRGEPTAAAVFALIALPGVWMAVRRRWRA